MDKHFQGNFQSNDSGKNNSNNIANVTLSVLESVHVCWGWKLADVQFRSYHARLWGCDHFRWALCSHICGLLILVLPRCLRTVRFINLAELLWCSQQESSITLHACASKALKWIFACAVSKLFQTSADPHGMLHLGVVIIRTTTFHDSWKVVEKLAIFSLDW